MRSIASFNFVFYFLGINHIVRLPWHVSCLNLLLALLSYVRFFGLRLRALVHPSALMLSSSISYNLSYVLISARVTPFYCSEISRP